MTVAGPLLTEDLDRPYEYRTFKVGDRVRVRLSPECRLSGPPGSYKDRLGRRGHCEDLDGMVGSVVSINQPNYIEPSHPYRVTMDNKFVWRGMHFIGDDFASSELEPLDPEAR